MFREGQYLEVIKASDNCLATAVVTVQQKTIEIKNEQVSTNKWLNLEDWAALYKILEKAILRNVQTDGTQGGIENKRRKSVRQLEVTYTFERPENVKDIASLPTIRVNVSPAKKKSRKSRKSRSPEPRLEKEESRERISKKSHTFDSTHHKNSELLLRKSENIDTTKGLNVIKNNKSKRYLQLESFDSNTLEEYVPDVPATKKLCTHLKYVPSSKSTLERIQVASNEYFPTVSDNKRAAEVIRYVPNPVDSLKFSYEPYEPRATTIVDLPEQYVPNSKGVKASVEEYQPDFTSKSMKFDDSYVPSSVQLINKTAKDPTEKSKKQSSEKHSSRYKEVLHKKNMDLFT